MPVEVKNLRIKVNVSGQKAEESPSDEAKIWSSNDVMEAMQQLLKQQKER